MVLEKVANAKIALLNSFGMSAISLCSKLDNSNKNDFLLKISFDDLIINLINYYPSKEIQAAAEDAAISHVKTKNKAGSIKAVQPYVKNIKSSILDLKFKTN